MRVDNKSPLDNIRPILLKKLWSFSNHTKKLLQDAITKLGRKFPPEYKKTFTRPIPKPRSFRPIQLSSQVSKTAERVIARRISSHLNFGLPDFHFGGRSYSGTAEAILLAQHEVTRRVSAAFCLFCDIAKAFDRVNHRRLLANMVNLGFDQSIVLWIKIWLCSRNFLSKWMINLLTPRVLWPTGSPRDRRWVHYCGRSIYPLWKQKEVLSFIWIIFLSSRTLSRRWEMLSRILKNGRPLIWLNLTSTRQNSWHLVP